MMLLTDEEIDRIVLLCYTDNKISCVQWAVKEGIKAQLKKVVEWGEEECPHKTVRAGGIYQLYHRRDCPQCWQSLLEEVKE